MAVWKDIKGYESLYKVSDQGEVLNIRYNIILKPHMQTGRDNKSYHIIQLTKSGTLKSFYLDELVWKAFNGDFDRKYINHIDNDFTNDSLFNLELVDLLPHIDKDEVWKYINGYDSYEVSNYGRILSLPKKYSHRYPIILHPNFDSAGYYIVTLCKNKTYTTKAIHRLVAEAFIENPLIGPVSIIKMVIKPIMLLKI